MNYKKIYNNIIEYRKNNILDSGYTEKHHIIPRSINGSNDTDNIVELTAREHFICHFLLAKMYEKYTFEWYKMNHAFLMMKSQSIYQNRYFNSRLYDFMRENFSEVMSKNQLGEKNSQFGKMWIYNSTTYDSKKIDKSVQLPNGWCIGRVSKNTKRKICKKCGQTECIEHDICKNGQRIKRMINNFNFNPLVIGTSLFYTEYYSVVEKLKTEYIIEKLSVEDMRIKYNIATNETMRCILKSLGIERRGFSEAVVNFNNKHR